MAIIGRFGGAVSEVHALSVHVAGHGGLRGRDAEALRENAHIVRRAAAVPQHLLVRQVAVRGVSLRLAGPDDCEHLLDNELVLLVRGAMGILNVIDNALEVSVCLSQRRERDLEAVEGGVEGVLVHLGALRE